MELELYIFHLYQFHIFKIVYILNMSIEKFHLEMQNIII